MDRLTRIYGLKAYRAWMQSLASRRPLDDVSRYQEADEQAERWVISSYPERVRAASFLSIMNKRLRWFNQHTRYEKDGEIVRFVGG